MTAALVLAGLFGAETGYAAGAGVAIDASNFPDPIFRSVIAGSDYDRDGNGILDANEIALTINVYCEGMGIQSLQGIEHFTAVQGLWCKDNQIASMDLSQNKDLHGVWCSGNLFTSLDFSANPELEWVYCYDCNLTSLNVSNNPKMAFIECNTNPLPILDVSHNPLLEHLTCGTCELTSLNLSNCPNLSHLDAFGNHLTTLDVSHNTKLKRLDIWNNPGLGSIDVSHNPGLQYYNCAYNGVTSIDVSGNPELQKLICSYNGALKSLDLSHNPKLVYLDCACDGIDNLDLSYNSELYFLQAFTNPFTTLNIGNNRFLIKTYQDGAKKAEYDVCQGHSWTIDYGGDTSTGGDNIYFLCVDDKVKITMEPKEVKAAEGSDGKGSAGNGAGGSSTGEGSAGGAEGVNEQALLTRELAAQTLYEMAGSPGVVGLSSRFTDVQKGAWYENALLWGEKNSICVGSPDISSDTFGVGEWITRQDLILMLMRYCEFKDYKRAIDFGRSDDFSDYYDVDYYAWEAICWAATWQITDFEGDPNAPKEQRRINPHGNATKADFESMLKRLLEVNGVKGSVKLAEAPEGEGEAQESAGEGAEGNAGAGSEGETQGASGSGTQADENDATEGNAEGIGNEVGKTKGSQGNAGSGAQGMANDAAEGNAEGSSDEVGKTEGSQGNAGSGNEGSTQGLGSGSKLLIILAVVLCALIVGLVGGLIYWKKKKGDKI
ncbi:MAG: hypothetical protein J5546_04920 [Lachnospiraceae bacterium]|nr:hypothetical protein [Lachnospiraceae bacterium]